MEWALYCPVYGYYEKEEDTPGRRGDYYTSVSVGSLFGELLALRFSEWLAQMAGEEKPRRFVVADEKPAGETPALPGLLQIVEAGAHTGALAADILTWLRTQRPEISEIIEYWIVEPSDRRREWQRRRLAEFGSQVRWAKSLAELSRCVRDPQSRANRQGIRGLIFSNELLDAMPVHRLGWDAKRSVWFEWGVTVCNGSLQWTRLTEAQTEIALPQVGLDPKRQHQILFGAVPDRRPAEVLGTLPDGFAVEVCPEATRWWSEAATILERGKLLTIDYGLCEQERLAPGREGGTLRAYYRHHLSSDLLGNPGAQDITAHVDFSMLRQAGEAAGLTTESLLTQEQFLTRIAGRVFNHKSSFGEWTADRTRQFRTLTHPEHLGHVFRVLVQGRAGRKSEARPAATARQRGERPKAERSPRSEIRTDPN